MRIAPVHIDDVPQLRGLLESTEQYMGFMSQDTLLMAHCPDMLVSMGPMVQSILAGGTVNGGLKRMIGYMVSNIAGCKYCTAHTANASGTYGISLDKMNAIWEYETSNLFTDGERAALRLAHHAAMQPNATTDSDIAHLKQYYSDAEIIEMVYVISLYGFLNKFNHTLQTTIEDKPLAALNKLDIHE